MRKTKIEWCDATWNPVTGCFHDCPYCYAEKIANRFGGASYSINTECGFDCDFIEAEGKLHDLQEPIYDPDRGHNSPYPYEFDPTFHRYKLDELQHWKKPRTIFVCSMADLFGEWVPGEWIQKVFQACREAPQHRYLFLTKNTKRYVQLFDAGIIPAEHNFWYGSSVTTEKDPYITGGDINAFISFEPLLEPIFFYVPRLLTGVKWIIVGAETGNRKGKVVPEFSWIEDICRLADEAGIPVFMKDSLRPIMGEENMRREFPWDNVSCT